MTRIFKVICVVLLFSIVELTTACHKRSTALPAPNNNSNHDTSKIDTPTVSNSAYDSAMMYFSKEMDIYRSVSGIDSVGRYVDCGVGRFIDTITGFTIKVNGIKLDFSDDLQWWLKHFDSSTTPGYPIYDSARIQFIAPNGFKDLDYRMPYMPFHPETVPYIVSKNGFNIPIVANDLAGADSVHVNVTGGYFDTTFKITDCNVYVDSARLHHMYSSFPADGLINIHAYRWFNVSSHGKKYSILNTSTASYHVLVQ